MRQKLIGLFIVAVIGIVLVLFFLKRVNMPFPILTQNPQGLASSTVSEVKIHRAKWLSPEGKRLWVTARSEGNSSGKVAVLVDLVEKKSRVLVQNAVPIAWLTEGEVLFTSVSNTDVNWKRALRKLGMSIPRMYATKFFRIDIESGQVQEIAEVLSESHSDHCAVSPDRRRLVGTWWPAQCHEIDLISGRVSELITEQYT